LAPPSSPLFPYTTALPICFAVPDAAPDDCPDRRLCETKRVQLGDALGSGAFLGLGCPGVKPHGSTTNFDLQWCSRCGQPVQFQGDRKSTRLNSSHSQISYA